MTPPQLNDLRPQYRSLKVEIDGAVAAALADGQHILGPRTQRFEELFAAYCDTRWGVGTGSGTDAVRIALQALGIGPGDAVATVANAGVPPVAAIVAAGARPVFVDVQPDTGNLDPVALDDVQDPGVKAVLVVHLNGQPADMAEISTVARARGWKLVSDCSHAHGASYRGRSVGALGDASAFSFYPTKNLGAVGDAGMILTAHEPTALKALSLRNYGWDAQRVSRVATGHSRLDDVQAAVLTVKLPHLDAWNARRQALAARYCALLERCVELPVRREAASSVHHLFVIRTPQRQGLAQHLSSQGIGTGVHYAPVAYQHPAYAAWAPKGGCPVAEVRAAEVLSLPMFPDLEEEQVGLVANSVRSFFARTRIR